MLSNRPRPFTSPGTSKFFKPAFQYLSNITNTPKPYRTHGRSSSIDGSDLESFRDHDTPLDLAPSSNMNQLSNRSSGELHPTPVPLIDFSRSPSPYARNRSAVHSEDEDDELEPVAPIQPLIDQTIGNSRQRWQDSLNEGGLGGWLFGSPLGWQVYVGLLVFLVGGCGFVLLLMNRFILWSMYCYQHGKLSQILANPFSNSWCLQVMRPSSPSTYP